MLSSPTKAWKRSARISTSPASTRRRLLAPGAAPAPAHDALHARDDLLGVAGLGHPVVGPEAQPAHPLGDRGGPGADDDAELRKRLAEALQPAPRLGPEHGQVHHQRAQAHRHDGLAGDRALEHAVLPAEAVHALAQDLDEAAVAIEYRDPQGRCGGCALRG